MPHSRSAIISERSDTQGYYFSLEFIPPWQPNDFSPGPSTLVKLEEQHLARGDLQVKNQLTVLIHQCYSLLIQLKEKAKQFPIEVVASFKACNLTTIQVSEGYGRCSYVNRWPAYLADISMSAVTVNFNLPAKKLHSTWMLRADVVGSGWCLSQWL